VLIATHKAQVRQRDAAREEEREWRQAKRETQAADATTADAGATGLIAAWQEVMRWFRSLPWPPWARR
jgi:hypothetical protein